GVQCGIDARDSCRTAAEHRASRDEQPDRVLADRNVDGWSPDREGPERRPRLWVDTRDRLVVLADYPDAAAAESDPRGSRSHRDLADDPVRVGIDDADRVWCDGGEAARIAV